MALLLPLKRTCILQSEWKYLKNLKSGYSLATLSVSSLSSRGRHDTVRPGGCQRSGKGLLGGSSYFIVTTTSPPFLSKGCANVSGNLTLPPLMNGAPPIMWPKIINTIRNWIFTYFVIRPHMDRDFSQADFDKGARQAVSLISTKLSTGEFEDLEDVVCPVALAEIKKNLENFNVAQRQLLVVEPDDIFFSFPFEIGIIIPDEQPQSRHMEGEETRPAQVRHVEITYVFHVLRGMHLDAEELREKSFKEFVDSDETKKRIMVCNYRFFRDFTEGSDPRWIVNMVNHFLPAEMNQGDSSR